MYLFLFFSILSLFINYDHYLNSLLLFEFILLGGLIFIGLFSLELGVFIIYLLILGVCDGILGLVLMVYVIRFEGWDFFSVVDYSVY